MTMSDTLMPPRDAAGACSPRLIDLDQEHQPISDFYLSRACTARPTSATASACGAAVDRPVASGITTAMAARRINPMDELTLNAAEVLKVRFPLGEEQYRAGHCWEQGGDRYTWPLAFIDALLALSGKADAL